MLDKERIVRIFEKNIEENQLSLSPLQKDVYTAIACLASNADNLNQDDLDIIRRMMLKGYSDTL
jgi:hypothetical protein